jgi:hypothetical protein
MATDTSLRSSKKMASRCYNLEDQHIFAQFSGDKNVMHIDPIAARRTQAGGPAVHGVHNLLWALDCFARSGIDLTIYSSLRVDFQKFLLVGKRCNLNIIQKSDKLLANIDCDGTSVVSIVARKAQPEIKATSGVEDLPSILSKEADTLEMGEMEGLEGWLSTPSNSKNLFPHLSKQLGREKVHSLALLSTVVGMRCPGMHSIFSRLKVNFGDVGHTRLGLGYRCISIDQRFRLATIDAFSSGFTAEISAFVRIPPIRMPHVADLQGHTGLNLTGRRALIIGGTRGLGEATAKLFAASGGKVTLSYATGKNDAEEIVNEIMQVHGKTAASCIHYDSTNPADPQLADMRSTPTDMYYFATERITPVERRSFDQTTFDTFSNIYLNGFADLCDVLAKHAGQQPMNILYPSSVMVDETPSGLAEYAMVKAAGEVLCKHLSDLYPQLSIFSPRIPRVLTDQTASIIAVNAEDPVDVISLLFRTIYPVISSRLR